MSWYGKRVVKALTNIIIWLVAYISAHRKSTEYVHRIKFKASRPNAKVTSFLHNKSDGRNYNHLKDIHFEN